MSTVTLAIGPKSYTIACADGEEPQIEKLGAMIAEKYAKLGSGRAPLEAQNLLFAALFLADELAEARKAAAAVHEPAPEPDAVAAPVPAADNSAAIEVLHAAIARLEGELEAARKAAAQPAPAPAAAPQQDLFGGPALSDLLVDTMAKRLEDLAARAEASAAALEAAAANA